MTAPLSPANRPAVGDVVAWRRTGSDWAFGVVELLDRVRAEVRVIAGSPSKTASRPYSGLLTVLTAEVFAYGLDQSLQQALAALDGAGREQTGAERQ